MGRITKNAIALRIARRSVKRNRLQSALIIAIIALPMALAGLALVFSESTKPTGAELVKFQLGDAKARFQVVNPPDENAFQLPQDTYLSFGDQGPNQVGNYVSIEQALPGRHLVRLSEAVVEFKTATGIGSVQVVAGETWTGSLLGKGPVTLVHGHVPIGNSEALLSQDALDRFDVKVGESIETTSGQKFKVSGVLAEASRRSNEDVVYVRQGAISSLAADVRADKYFQIDGSAPTWPEIQALNKQGIVVVSRHVLLNPPPANQTRASDVGASVGRLIAALFLAPLVLLPVIVLAGSAFAFGARRQTRTLAVLSSLGAERSLLRKVTLASGVWLGFLGGLLGLTVGVLVAYLFGEKIADVIQGGHNWPYYPGFHVPYQLLGIALLCSVLLGAATSLVPAIRASKVNILATLRGSRTEGTVRLRAGVGAAVILLAGVGLISASLLILISANGKQTDFMARQLLQIVGVLLGLGGAIITIVSFMVATGWVLVFVRKVLSRFGSIANFAGKDLLFNRKRYSPVIASVLTVTFLASFVASFFYGPTKYQSDNYNYQFLPGQAGKYFQVKPDGLDQSNPVLAAVSAEDFWNGVPKRELAESERKLILSTGSFDSATIIDTTIDIYASPGTTQGDGTLAPQFDVPTPTIIYNPDLMCYYTGLSPKSQEWQQSHITSMTQADMKEPAGCADLEMPNPTMVVGDVRELRSIIKTRDADAENVLDNGGVVLFNKAYNYSGVAKLSWIKPSNYGWSAHNLDSATKTVELPTKVIDKITSPSFAFGAMISRETAAKYGIKAYPMVILVNYQGEVPAATTDKLNARDVYLQYGNGTGILNPETFAWVIILLAGLFSLASTGIALGLSQIEARTDKRTLSAIGAPRSFRAKLVSIQALTLTLTGSILGALTGLMLGAAMLNGMDASMAKFPWTQLAALVLGVPTIAALAFWLFTPRSLKYEVRQALD
jgi:putative ABC transport system permease protein